MNPSKHLTTTLSTVAIVVILGGIYWFFFAGTAAPTSPLSQTLVGGAGNQAFVLTSQLSDISFNTSIFSDPRFASLRDLSTPVNPEPGGRTDPFAPL